MHFFSRLRVLLVTVWAGSLWTIGYLVAPTLFASLHDRVLAGTIAGTLFHVQAWVSIVCALVLLVLLAARRGGAQRRSSWGAEQAPFPGKLMVGLVLAMLACTLVSYFGLQPAMAVLREGAGAGGVMESAARGRFGLLHGVSSGLYLLQSLLAVALVWKAR